MVACSFFLGVTGQMIKLCADSAMQIDVDDALRGHVFAVQDALFWVAFIVSITVAATVIPDDGHAPGFVLFGSVLYLTRAVVHSIVGRRGQPATSLGTGDPRRYVGGNDGGTRADRGRPACRKRRPRRVGDATSRRPLGRSDAGARLDHRTPDRTPVVDRPGCADRRSPTRLGSPKRWPPRRRILSASSTRAPRNWRP